MEFVKPQIEYAQLWPMLLVFGVACAGVLVEAFLPRAARYAVQSLLTLAGLVAALVGTCLVAADLPTLGDGAARGLIAAEGTIAVDGPSVFLWGLVLVFAIGGVLLFAERRLEGGRHRLRRAGGCAPRHRGRAPGLDRRAWSTPRSTRWSCSRSAG